MICKETRSCFFKLLESCVDVRCPNKHKCLDFCDNRSDATCKENKRVYHLLNTKDRRYKILSVHINGGVIIVDKQTPPNVSKCDYLYLVNVEEKPVAILIELKGTEFLKAVDQLKNTLNLFKDAFNQCGKVYGRIVFAGGTPNIQNIPAVMSLTRDLKRRGGDLLAAESLSDRIEDMC